MCIFSRPVHSVSATRIFARDSGDTQVLAYGMHYRAPSELAMVLPLPVPPGTPEADVRFIDLQGYPDFFADLERGFELPTGSGDMVFLDRSDEKKLAVHTVGSFEASFVPAVKDFARLDERFRLPDEVWSRMPPEYESWGFAVFKLRSAVADTTVHPMAFMFPRRYTDRLFFPTVHVHDRTVDDSAEFDHVLYCQPSSEKKPAGDWTRSVQTVEEFVDMRRVRGVVASGRKCFRLRLVGMLPNRDSWADFAQRTRAPAAATSRAEELDRMNEEFFPHAGQKDLLLMPMYLRAMGEHSLAGPHPPGRESYRLLRLGSWLPSLMARIERGNGERSLVAARWMGIPFAPKHIPEHPAEHVKRQLSSAEAEQFDALVRSAKLEHMSDRTSRQTLDGSIWMLEVVRAGEHRVITRWSPERHAPDAGLVALGEWMLAVAGLERRGTLSP